MIRYTYKILFLCQLLYHGLSKCGRERAKNLWETDAVSEDNDSLVIFPTDDFLSKSPTNYIPIYTVFLIVLRFAPKYAILGQFCNLLTLRCL